MLALHALAVGVPPDQSSFRVRDRSLLESALARPRHAEAYEDADLATQVATLLWGIVRNHPFIDGNKRTSVAVALVFAEMNGHRLRATDDELFDIVVGVANQRRTVDDVAAFMRKRLRRIRRR